MNKKIKVIDLIDKKYHNLELPKHIRVNKLEYFYNENRKTYDSEYGEQMSFDFTDNVLNMEVEILEDNIEKIEIIKMTDFLNMVAQGLIEDKTRIRIYSIGDESGIPYICEYDKSNTGKIWCISSYDTKFELKIDYMKILNYYVEILKDNIQ